MDHEKTVALKQRAVHEFKDFMKISLYLAFFFCAVTLYTNLLLDKSHTWYLSYGAAVITALVTAKVILIGEAAKLGKRHESKSVFVAAIYKAFLFSLLVFAFHFVEELIKRLLHHGAAAEVSVGSHLHIQLARALVIFWAFIPLFTFMELRRVVGEEKFQRLVFYRREDERGEAA
jgi:hypothetical protein